jgi:hypothetical protein
MSGAPDIFRSKALRTLKWFLWKAAWPSTVLLLFYPLYLFIINSDEPFAHAFGHGDFLLLSFVLLIETSLDSEHLNHGKMWLEVLRHVSIWCSLVFTLVFAASKFDILVILPGLSEAARCVRMTMYAKLNCYAVVIAVVLSIVAYYAVCEIEEEFALKKAAE